MAASPRRLLSAMLSAPRSLMKQGNYSNPTFLPPQCSTKAGPNPYQLCSLCAQHLDTRTGTGMWLPSQFHRKFSGQRIATPRRRCSLDIVRSIARAVR